MIRPKIVLPTREHKKCRRRRKSVEIRPSPHINYLLIAEVCRSVLRRNGGIGEIDMEDFVQDVCVKLLEKQTTFNGKSSWKTWVYAVARNLWISKKRHAEVEARYQESTRRERA